MFVNKNKTNNFDILFILVVPDFDWQLNKFYSYIYGKILKGLFICCLNNSISHADSKNQIGIGELLKAVIDLKRQKFVNGA